MKKKPESVKHNKNTGKRIPPATAWKKGQSGNRNGRPKTGEAFAEIIRAALSETDPKTKKDKLITLIDIAYTRAKSTRKDAIRYLEFLVNRGWQKLPEAHEVTGEGGAPIAVTFSSHFDGV